MIPEQDVADRFLVRNIRESGFAAGAHFLFFGKKSGACQRSGGTSALVRRALW
jgi:hypothetical protein